jgi:hypothetical protein
MLDDKTKENIDVIRHAVDVIANLTIKQSPLDDYKEMFDFSDKNRNRLPQEYAEKAATFQTWAIKQNGLIISYEKVSFYLTAGAAAFILAIIVIA